MMAWRFALVLLAIAAVLAQRSLKFWAPSGIVAQLGSKRITQALVGVVIVSEGVMVGLGAHAEALDVWLCGACSGLGLATFVGALWPKAFLSEQPL